MEENCKDVTKTKMKNHLQESKNEKGDEKGKSWVEQKSRVGNGKS